MKNKQVEIDFSRINNNEASSQIINKFSIGKEKNWGIIRYRKIDNLHCGGKTD